MLDKKRATDQLTVVTNLSENDDTTVSALLVKFSLLLAGHSQSSILVAFLVQILSCRCYKHAVGKMPTGTFANSCWPKGHLDCQQTRGVDYFNVQPSVSTLCRNPLVPAPSG
jgi:hypothetical protein